MPGGLEQLPHRVNGELASWIELDGLAVVFDGLARLAERRLSPQTTKLLVHEGSHRANRPILNQRGQRLGTPFQQGDERFGVTLLTVQLRQAVRRIGLGRVSIDGDHEGTRCAVHIAQACRPNVCRLGQPVTRVCWVRRSCAHLFEKHRVCTRVRLPGFVRNSDCFFVVWVLDQALNQRLHLTGVHVGGNLPCGLSPCHQPVRALSVIPTRPRPEESTATRPFGLGNAGAGWIRGNPITRFRSLRHPCGVPAADGCE